MKKLLIILNEPTTFLSHRLPIAIAAREAGYEVHVATGVATPPPAIQAAGLHYHALPLSRSGKNVVAEGKTLLSLYRLMKKVKPDVMLLVTIKPVLYGTIVARVAGVPQVVAAISGLGYVFTHNHLKARLLRQIVSCLYRLGFKHKHLQVIFQNPSDKAILSRMQLFQEHQAVLIPGAGVDLKQYIFYPESPSTPLIVVMAARLLKDKGVLEYVEAARQLKSQAEFWLAGELDPGNPSSITAETLAQWQVEGIVKILGKITDIPTLFSKAHIVVLPSYREGLPRVLSEAAACGRPVVTTDVPGCRDAILPNKTGLLVPVKDASTLAQAIQTLLQNSDLRQTMGAHARAFAEKTFDIKQVVKRHLEIFEGQADIVP